MKNASDRLINRLDTAWGKNPWAWGYDNRNFQNWKSKRRNDWEKKNRIRLCLLLLFVQLQSRVWLFCDPLDYSPSSSSVHGISRLEHWRGLPFPSPGDLPKSGTETEPLILAGGFSPLRHYLLREPNPPPVVSSSVSSPNSWRILSPWAVSYNYRTFPKEWSCLDPSFSFLPTSHGMWDLPPTRDGTHAPYSGSMESQSLDHQVSPLYLSLSAFTFT